MEPNIDPLSPPKRGIVDAIKRSGAASVEDLVARTGLGATTVRQHLDDLRQSGLVNRSAERKGRGRPSYRYTLTSRASAIYPTHDAEVLRGLLRHLSEQGGEALVESFFEKFWAEREARFEALRDAAGAETPGERAEVLRAMLVEEGFLPEVVYGRDGAVTVRECNCPFRETVRGTFAPCRLEAAFMERALGRPLVRVEFMPQGASACSYATGPSL